MSDCIGVILGGTGVHVPPTFWTGGTRTPIFYELSQLWDDYSRLTQRLEDSLDKFVEEERVRKEARNGKWRRQGRERHIRYPHFLAQSNANG